MPAQAGIHDIEPAETCVDGRLRGHDEREWTGILPLGPQYSSIESAASLC
jgi:hypothetical protein